MLPKLERGEIIIIDNASFHKGEYISWGGDKEVGSLELTVIFLPNQKNKLICALENCLALEKPYPCRIINLIRLFIPDMTPLVVRLAK